MAEKQRVLRFCENRKVKIKKENTLGRYIRTDKTQEAWYCLREYLQIVKGWKGMNWLPVDERFAMPVSPYLPEKLSKEHIKELTNQDNVADESCNFTRAQNDINQHKSRYYDMLGLAALGAVFAVILVAMLAMSGKIDIGKMFGGG